MMHTPNKVVGLCVEPGPLELQALMCVRSIRRFGNLSSSDNIIIVSPRGRKLSQRAYSLLAEEKCTIRVQDINVTHARSGLANKPYAAEWIATQYPASSLLFIDCDTIITNDLTPLFALASTRSHSIVARPVGKAGFRNTPGSFGLTDPNDRVWVNAYRVAGVEFSESDHIPVTWAPHTIRGYWNSGVLCTSHLSFFSHWRRCFETLFVQQIPEQLINKNYFEQFTCSIAIKQARLNCVGDPLSNVGLEELATIKGPPRIIHYAGSAKSTVVRIAKASPSSSQLPYIRMLDAINPDVRKLMESTFQDLTPTHN